MNWLFKIFGSKNDRLISQYKKTLTKSTQPHYERLQKMDRQELNDCWQDFLQKRTDYAYRERRALVFAFVRRYSELVLGLKHYDMQLVGGMALSDGHIAEMATGEGKTLVATAPSIFESLEGHKVFVVTVNDYLASRDAHLNLPLYQAMGLSVGIVTNHTPTHEKKLSYQKDIVYVTNTRLGFDYLEDRTAMRPEDLILPSLDFVIIDEVDSILIDEARKPLIISASKAQDLSLYPKVRELIPHLTLVSDPLMPESGDFNIDIKTQHLDLTETGHIHLERICREKELIGPEESLYDPQYAELMHLIHISLKAEYLYHKEKDYLVIHGQVVIVNEHTGRLSQGQRLSEGLHQALEAKEGVEIQKESMTIASITYQNFFKKFKKIAGMTGTADTEAREFHEIYGLDVVVIPSNKPVIRQDKPDLIFVNQEMQERALIQAIIEHHQVGRPILVGTRSIDRSEHLSLLLHKQKIPHTVLNAKYHEQEAEIIAQAGKKGAVTIATNMAGRGTDVILGGTYAHFQAQYPQGSLNEWKELQDEVRHLGGLQVLGCERNDSRRIDLQLRGRSGRQGDPGSSQFYVHLDDQLLKVLPRSIVDLIRYCHPNHEEPISDPLMDKRIADLQKAKEGLYFDARKQSLEDDNVINDQRDVIYACRDEILKSHDLNPTIQHYFFEGLKTLKESFSDENALEEKFFEFIEKNYMISLREMGDHVEESDQGSHIMRQAQFLFQGYKQKTSLLDAEQIANFEKDFLLRYLDSLWREHIAQLESIRQQVSLRGYAQKDPRQEYKIEAFQLFERMMASYARQVMHTFLKIRFVENTQNQTIATHPTKTQRDSKPYKVGLEETHRPGRNEPCLCGSGQKFKSCCGTVQRLKQQEKEPISS